MVKKIALEEHFLAPGYEEYWRPTVGNVDPEVASGILERLTDFRCRYGLGPWIGRASRAPSFRSPGPGCRASATRRWRNAGRARPTTFSAREIGKRPDRYYGFAHLAMQDARSAADELERCVRELKFYGAMINGHTDGQYLDHPSLYRSGNGPRNCWRRSISIPPIRLRRRLRSTARGCAARPGEWGLKSARPARAAPRFQRACSIARPAGTHYARPVSARPAVAARRSKPRQLYDGVSSAKSRPLVRRISWSRRPACAREAAQHWRPPLSAQIASCSPPTIRSTAEEAGSHRRTPLTSGIRKVLAFS